MISAFHSAHARARAQAPSSAAIASRKTSRAAPANEVQVITRSHAGSPTPLVPKSITAASRPLRRSRLPRATSPWNHVGTPSNRAARPSSHTRRAAAPSTLSASTSRASRVPSS